MFKCIQCEAEAFANFSYPVHDPVGYPQGFASYNVCKKCGAEVESKLLGTPAGTALIVSKPK